MRYLVSSDLHYELPQLDWIASQADEFDAVVLAGDHLDVVGRAEINAQISLMIAYLGRLAERTTVIANSGNHDLDSRRPDGEKSAAWMSEIDARVATDGATVSVGDDLVSVCAWWEGPETLRLVEQQLAVDAAQPREGAWIWAYHSPPDASPTSWSGARHYGDDVLNRLIDEHRPDLVLTGHVHEAPFRPDGSWYDRVGSTLVLNAGRQTGPVPAHLIVDTAAREVAWWTFSDQATVTW
jgi:Icc-related predicted phosphoesterase